MLDYIKKLITPDMVSLWVPSGINRAQDLIRGNHGQCYGTHPNVPVLPNLINPSVGWHFDGGAAHMDLTGVTNGSTSFSVSCWFYSREDKTSYLFDIESGRAGVMVHYNSALGLYDSTTWRPIGSVPSLDNWHHLVLVLNGSTSKLNAYLDTAHHGSEVAFTPCSIGGNVVLGSRYSMDGSYFNGYIALPFMANKAWSIAQVENFYNATKGMFAPRG